jgi:hypothetical protein
MKPNQTASSSAKGARRMSIRADASPVDTEDLNKKLKEVTETISEKWGCAAVESS